MIVVFLIVVMTIITFFERYAMLELSNRIKLPMWLMRSLRFVPAALLTAIAIPGLVYRAGELDLSPMNERIIAGIVTSLVAWRTRNAIWSMLAGMLVVWGAVWLRG
jgi:branched-subunit amino acid transport protein